MVNRRLAILLCVLFAVSPMALLRGQDKDTLIDIPQDDSIAPGPLIPSTSRMDRAWDFPRNPLTDSVADDSYLARQIRYGFELFMNTSEKAPVLTGNSLSCANCHLNGGQREKALPLVGVAGNFPEYSKRSGRLSSLEDRIIGCFERSMNGAGELNGHPRSQRKLSTLNAHTPEVLALASYITWLSAGYPIGSDVAWRGRNKIAKDHLIPVEKLDAGRGKKLFLEHCTSCHGKDGQGVQIGDKKAGPLWGPNSWNDGAGAARVYTLAGMIRYMMPYLDPGILTDEEAQQIAAYINSQPRPVFPWKANDYLTEEIPPDAVYYHRSASRSMGQKDR